ncbi:dTDP-4-amino-4,6-dideoxygalactose transaminase [Treponema primitia]|uniref:dTDP-4-amino-4,6-dideoxygalactose transaminase n=1 Tax=Treponema primitia TaxID=88058 RepID=UPI0002554EEB|nr:dTDP-4-amino-4,6-dideoxygalactose transaminase [Treponema primitia]
MIPFNRPPCLGTELEYIRQVLESRKLCGDGPFTKNCHQWFEENTDTSRALLTTSCTHALEMAAILVDIKPGDEVIMPSYTFVSTANAFVLRGAKIVFVDIRPDTMNIDENLIEDAVTKRTKAIVVVHYAGVACEMDTILAIAHTYKLFVIEDAAQGIGAKYKSRSLGTVGNMGCYSFHETKNVSCGEGGALLIQDEELVERAEILREKGTNRSKFWRGQVDKYTWLDIGSSYLPSELNAAYLYAQLQSIDKINADRLKTWNRYYEGLKPLAEKGHIDLPHIPQECEHNTHIFYIKVKDIEERNKLIDYLNAASILSVFHYIPLHTSPAGKQFGRFQGIDRWTTKESERLLRLPMYYGMEEMDRETILNNIKAFFYGK